MSTQSDIDLCKEWLALRGTNGAMTVEVEAAKGRLVLDALARLVVGLYGHDSSLNTAETTYPTWKQ